MKKFIIFQCFILLCSALSFGQPYSIVKDDWKLGLQDNNGKIILPCRWENITQVPNSEYFVVMLGKRYGLVNNRGEIVVPVKFSYIIPRLFGDKLMVNMGASIISSATHTIEIESKFILKYKLKDQPTDFLQACYYPIEKTSWMPRIDNYIVGGKWGIYNLKEYIPSVSPSYDLLQVIPNEDRYVGLGYTYSGVANYNIYDLQNDTFVFEFSAKNKKMISSMTLLSNGWAMVNDEIVNYNGQLTVITSNAVEAIDASRKYALVSIKRKGGVLYNKETGEVVMNDIQIYDLNTSLTHRMAFAVNSLGRVSLITDYQCVEIDTDDDSFAFMGDFFMTFKSNSPSVSVWNMDGRLISKTLINKFQEMDSGHSLFFIDQRGYLCRVNSSNYYLQSICNGCANFGIYPFAPDLALIAKESGWNNLWGIINLNTSKEVLPCNYPELSLINEDVYAIQNGSRISLHSIKDTTFSMNCYRIFYDELTNDDLCWIMESESSTGLRLFNLDSLKFLTENLYQPQVLAYDASHPIMMNGDFYPVTNGAKWGILDRNGKIVIDIKYAQIFPFLSSEGFFIVSGDDGKFGYINPYSKVVLPCVFDDVGQFSNGVCAVMKLGKWGLADKDGNVLLSPQYNSIGDFHADIFWLKKNNFNSLISYAVKLDGSIDWIDSNGKILCNTKTIAPSINNVVPNGLWDF